MDFKEYQEKAKTTAIYPKIGSNLVYAVLGLTGESGEVAERLKKIIREKDGVFDDEDRRLFVKELGDVLWYIACICWECGISMEDVAEKNIEKLLSRLNRGTLLGSGDDR